MERQFDAGFFALREPGDVGLMTQDDEDAQQDGDDLNRKWRVKSRCEKRKNCRGADGSQGNVTERQENREPHGQGKPEHGTHPGNLHSQTDEYA